MGGSPRNSTVSDAYGGMPRDMGNVQGYYASQRYGGRSEGDQMAQAKRRMAAQRERELRNYHQEQQYNRSKPTAAAPRRLNPGVGLIDPGILAEMPTGAKSDRSLSPGGMNEEERRELIARQHRALYGENSNIYSGEPPSSRPISQDARVSGPIGGGRGQSPLAFDPFGMQNSGVGDSSAVQMPSRDPAPGASSKDAAAPGGNNRSRANSNSSPASNPAQSFGLFENAQQSSRTTNSSPTNGSPPRQGPKPGGASAGGGGGVAPIGTRPAGSQAPGPGQALSKRATTPLPSPLSYGFSASEQQGLAAGERATSAASSSNADKGVGLGWGGSSGVWGGNGGKLGVQASVWG